jgi:hypothetical protein
VRAHGKALSTVEQGNVSTEKINQVQIERGRERPSSVMKKKRTTRTVGIFALIGVCVESALL